MARFIDSITAQPEELLSVEVPEWAEGDAACVIYFTPFSLADLKKIRNKARGSDEEAIVYTVIEKALDANGDRLFTVEDKQKLMNRVSSDVLARLVTEMNRLSSGN